MADLEIRGALLLNGEPVTCSGCGASAGISVDRRGLRETWPAWVGCGMCGHGEDHPVITNGLVDAALASRTGRHRAEDRDLFAAEWRHLSIAGECVPEFVLDDAVTLVEQLGKIGQQEVRARKRTARRWWSGRKRAACRAVRGAAGQAAGTVKSAALRAAWDLQTGGAGPQKTPRTRCRTKGCKGGWVTITTRIHAAGDKAEKVQVPCGVCHRA